MNTNIELTQRRTAAMPRGIGVLSNFHAAQADNALLTDAEGRQYIDFAAGIAVLNTGHRHPRVVGAIRQQLLRFTHTAFQIVPYENAIALAERLNALAPIAKPAKTALFTTGVEAVENAVKIARYGTGRSALIAFSGAFHGRTLLGLSLTGKVVPYKAGFGSMLPEVYHLPFPAPTLGVTVNDTLDALTRLFKADVDPQRVAAVIIEPVQGEGGFYPAPASLLEALRAVCDAHGILLIADEVQSGFGRTGRWFAMEHHGVQADLICMAKSLGGGLPLSAVTGRAEVMDAPPPGALGSTYAANPLSVAAAHAVLDIIDEQQLCARAEHLGLRLMARLRALQEHDAGLAEVRGLGSMVAVEFRAPGTGAPGTGAPGTGAPGTGAPDAERVNAVVHAAMSQGLLLLPCGVHGNVLRFLYPLTIEEPLFERALDILDKVLGRE